MIPGRRPRGGRSVARAASLSVGALLGLADAAAAETFLDLIEVRDTAHMIRPTHELDVAAAAALPHIEGPWGQPEAWGKSGISARWIEGPEAIVDVDVAVPRARQVRLRVCPVGGPLVSRPQSLEVLVNGRPIGSGDVPQGAWSWIVLESPRDAWRPGINRLTLKPAWVASPRELGVPQDPRPLSVAVSRIELQDRIGGNLLPMPGAAPEEPPVSGSFATLAGEGDLRFMLLVPPRATLSLELAKGDDRMGDGFRVELLAEADGLPERRLLARSFAGLAAGSTTRHVLDLAELGGRVVALTMRLDPGDAAWERGDVLRISRAAVEVPAMDAELARLRTVASPRYMPPILAGDGDGDGEGEPPSALVYLMDALRAADLSGYGEANPTSPHIDRLARRGALLAENFSQAPNTPPSVKAILTGRYLPSTGHGILPDDVGTMPEALAARGYRTAAFSNSPFVGENLGTHQGFDTLDTSLYVRGEAYAEKPPPKDYAGRIAAAITAWLDTIADAPFFAYVHTIHPHNPYTPLPPYDRLLTEPGLHGPYDGTTQALLDVKRGRLAPTPELVAGYHRLLYQEDIAYGDHALGLVLADLQRRGRRDATLVAVIADHGEEFLEHGSVLHGYTAFDEMLQVPLVMAGGGLPAGRLVTQVTQSIDLAATILDACGDPPADLEGRSLLPLLSDRGAPDSEAYASASSIPGIYSLRNEHFKYIYAPRRKGTRAGRADAASARLRTPRPRFLYDLDADPAELHDVADEQPILAAFLHERLLSWLEAVDDDRAGGAPPLECMPFDLCQKMIALGYVESGQCLCDCERYRHVWEQRRDGTLRGADSKLFESQLECCSECRTAYDAWAASSR